MASINSDTSPLSSQEKLMGRRAVVTTGSVEPFIELLDEVLSHDFLCALQSHGFTFMDVQAGKYLEQFQKKLDALEHHYRIEIKAFDFDPNMNMRFAACRGEEGVRPAGAVFSHAGTGTISEATMVEAPLVLIANPHLQDNHQAELATHMAETRPGIVEGRIGRLAESVPQIMDKIAQEHQKELDHRAMIAARRARFMEKNGQGRVQRALNSEVEREDYVRHTLD